MRSAKLSSVTGGCRDTFAIINKGVIIKLILLYIWIWEYNIIVIAHVGTGIYMQHCVRARVCIKTKCTHGHSTYSSIHTCIHVYIYIHIYINTYIYIHRGDRERKKEEQEGREREREEERGGRKHEGAVRLGIWRAQGSGSW
jgi:hypothetical protein